jgi:hypothetical protein
MELNLKFTEIQDVFPDTEGARRVSAMNGANQIFEQFSTNHYWIRSTTLSTSPTIAGSALPYSNTKYQYPL